MDFHSMFEEMHAAMAEMLEVRRTMVDRMFGGFGRSLFPSFPSLLEDFDRDFARDFSFPRTPYLLQQSGASAAPANLSRQTQPVQQQQQQCSEEVKLQPGLESSVMYSSQQYYNSADPSKNYSRCTTTQAGPAGVLESRTAIRDNKENLEKVEVRRQLGDRYTHVTRKRRLDTGEETVERKSQNVPDEALGRFEEEWNKFAKEHLPMYCKEAMGGAQVPQLDSSKVGPEVSLGKAHSKEGSIPVGTGTTQAGAQAQGASRPTTMEQTK